MHVYNAILSGYAAIFESLTPIRPKGVKYSSKRINEGTYRESQCRVAKWNDAMGNSVELVLIMEGPDKCEAVFAVNGSYDDAASGETTGKNRTLQEVMYMLRYMLDKHGIRHCTIRAMDGTGDKRVKHNLDMGDYRERAEGVLDEVIEALTSVVEHASVEREPTEHELKMLKLLKKQTTDFDPAKREKVALRDATTLRQNLDNVSVVALAKNMLGTPYITEELKDRAMLLLKEYHKRLASRSPEGYKYTRNRRYNIYSRLLPAYLGEEWNITLDEPFIELERMHAI
jgi:hypothetical protein